MRLRHIPNHSWINFFGVWLMNLREKKVKTKAVCLSIDEILKQNLSVYF